MATQATRYGGGRAARTSRSATTTTPTASGWHNPTDREISWDAGGGAWVVKECEKYVLNGEQNAPGDVPTAPHHYSETRRIEP